MACCLAVLEVALNAAASISLETVVASQIESLQVELASNFGSLIVNEVDLRSPVYADNVGPDVVLLINFLHEALLFVTQEATDVVALQRSVCFQNFAPIAEPLSLWNIVEDISAIASLMYSHIAELTDDQKVIVLVFVLKADVALDVLILEILLNTHIVVGVSLSLGFLHSLLLLLFSHRIELEGFRLWALNKLALHHDITLDFVKVSRHWARHWGTGLSSHMHMSHLATGVLLG